jgi:excisionase family DNA binding protein
MLLTVKDLSSWLNIKASTLYLWAAQGKIPCQKIHGLIRFDRERITTWLASFEGKQRVWIPAAHRMNVSELDQLIEAAKQDPYTGHHGETISPSPRKKEERNGAR